jgi:hypothetical protein
MNDSVLHQNIYIDTSALRGMSFNRDVASMLTLSKAGKVRLFISETTLWERGRQQFEKDCLGDRVVPFPDGLNRYLAWFKALFEKHGVIVIPSDDKILDQAAVHIQNDNTYFKQDDENDQRDAHVLATAESKLEKNTVILCSDNNLAQTYEKIAGFPNVRRDSKEFLLEIMGGEADFSPLEKPALDSLDDYQISITFTDSFRKFISCADHRSHEYLRTLPTVTDKLSAKLANMELLDAEIRKRVLGYAQWFSPVSKVDLRQLLEPRGYGGEQIENNAQRLKQEYLLIETENHWLTNTDDAEAKEICEQAMTVVMPEILEIMELS